MRFGFISIFLVNNILYAEYRLFWNYYFCLNSLELSGFNAVFYIWLNTFRSKVWVLHWVSRQYVFGLSCFWDSLAYFYIKKICRKYYCRSAFILSFLINSINVVSRVFNKISILYIFMWLGFLNFIPIIDFVILFSVFIGLNVSSLIVPWIVYIVVCRWYTLNYSYERR